MAWSLMRWSRLGTLSPSLGSSKRASRASVLGNGCVMTGRPNTRDVSPRDDGWAVTKPGADRASAVLPTQAAAVERAKEILANDGGGELRVRGRNGQVREQNTVPPGNDPKRSKG
ncbi:DUF2188 domain-containing protein [Streptomyces murinus]|uniref:DUF2188 domain-containing protein n=1 Tax=Streptomyces murinus TaxID=33900 RepID=UPI00372D3FA5